jgi:TolA-binding protein
MLCVVLTVIAGGPCRAQSETVVDPLEAGRAALSDELYTLAEQYFETFIEQAETRAQQAEGTLLLARALYGEGRYGEAVKLLDDRFRWSRRLSVRSGFIYWKARAQAAAGDCEAALSTLDELPELPSEEEHARGSIRLKAGCYAAMGDTQRALALHARFQQAYPDAPEAADNLLDWAELLMRTGDMEQAVSVLEKLREAYPGSPAARTAALWTARLQIKARRYKAARTSLMPLATTEDVAADLRAEAWYALAHVAEVQTNLDEALTAVESGLAAAEHPDIKTRGALYRGKLLVQLDRVEEGLSVIHDWVGQHRDDPDAPALQLELAETLLDAHRHELALQEFQNYLEAFDSAGGQARALMGKGWALFELGRYAEAATVFDKAFGVSTNNMRRKRALFKAADSLFANRQYEAAREKYLGVTQTFPGSPEAPQALFQAAESLVKLDQLEAAAKEFKAVEDAYPGSPFAEQAAIRIALVYELQGRWDDALRQYNEVMQRYADGLFYERALHGRGLILYRLGRFEEALSDFQEVVENHPDSELAEQAFYMRGWGLYLMGRNSEALELCRAFIQKYPESRWAPDVLFWLAEYHYNRENYGDAERRFAELAEQHPNTPFADDALFWAGRAAAAQKEYLRANEYYSELSEEYPDSQKLPEARFAQGDALSELGQFAGAILAFEEVIKRYPSSYLAELARGRKGDCQFTLASEDPSRYEEALASYRSLLEGEQTTPAVQLQAEYKVGRCLEKMGRGDEAFTHYMNVVYNYLSHQLRQESPGAVWFTRAAFSAATIKESESRWREAVNIYRRVIEAGVPAAEDARRRIQQIRMEHWFFY